MTPGHRDGDASPHPRRWRGRQGDRAAPRGPRPEPELERWPLGVRIATIAAAAALSWAGVYVIARVAMSLSGER